MTDTSWPDPSHRKVVLVLNQDDIVSLDYNEDGAELRNNEEAHILSSHPLEPGPGRASSD